MEASRLETAAEREHTELSGPKKDLEVAADLLGDWRAARGSDNIQVQEQRKAMYGRACGTLEELIHATGRFGYAVRLTLGAEPASSDWLSFECRRLIDKSELEAGDSMLFRISERKTDFRARVTHVFVGDYRRSMEVSDIPELLAAGGTLEVVPKNETHR